MIQNYLIEMIYAMFRKIIIQFFFLLQHLEENT